MSVNIHFKTNADEITKKLDKVEKKVKSVQKESSIRQGLQSLNERVQSSAIGGTPLADAVGSFTGKLGGITKLLNPWSAAITAAIGATTALHKFAEQAVENGMEAANQSETTTARLRGQLSAKGIIDAAPITAQLMRLQENGVASVEHLTDTFSKLVPVLHGNADEALFFVERLADMEAATGIGADGMAQLLMMIEQSGELESKTAKKLERAGIPIWKELAAVYDMSIDEVKALSKAHKIGVDEIKQALKNATKMYAGTAAALSGTTQGSKDSMEAAKKLAYMPAADAYNDMMREHYQARQAEFDAMASDKAWRQDMELIGNAEAQLSLLWKAIGELGESISNGALQCVANVIDYFKGWTTAGEIEERRINGGRDNLERVQKNMPNFDAQTAQNAFDALDKTLLKENAKLAEYIENKDLSSGAERDQWYKVIKAQELYIAAIKQTQLSLYELTKQQQQSAEDEAEKAAKLKNYNENLKAQQAAAYSGKDADAIAGAHLFSSADALSKVYEDLSAKVRAHVNLTDEELETLKELEKPYQAIQKLRADELASYQKTLAEQKTLDDSMVATADALRAEDEKRMMNGDAMRREYGESAAYNAAFDKLKTLADKLDNTDLSAGERESVLSKELAKMLADARAQSVHGTETTLDAKGIKGIKDFKYTDFSVDEKMLSVQEDIQRAAQDTNTLLETISTKLPAPIMAQ